MPEMEVTVVKQGSKVCLAEAWFSAVDARKKVETSVSESKYVPNHAVCRHLRHVRSFPKCIGWSVKSMFSVAVNRQVLEALALIVLLSVAQLSLPPLLGLWRGIDAASLDSLHEAPEALQQSQGIMVSSC